MFYDDFIIPDSLKKKSEQSQQQLVLRQSVAAATDRVSPPRRRERTYIMPHASTSPFNLRTFNFPLTKRLVLCGWV